MASNPKTGVPIRDRRGAPEVRLGLWGLIRDSKAKTGRVPMMGASREENSGGQDISGDSQRRRVSGEGAVACSGLHPC